MNGSVEEIESNTEKLFQYIVVAGSVIGYFESDRKVSVDDMIEINGGCYKVNNSHSIFHRTDGGPIPILYTSMNLNANSRS